MFYESDGSAPVSYTHLDVYKRQRFLFCHESYYIWWTGKHNGILSSGGTCILFSGASHPDVSDAGGDHLHTGGQYALDSQAEQDQYEGELQCLSDRVETPEEKKRLSEAMELSNIREHLKSQEDVYKRQMYMW